ncbi:AraC family transcriptional regulator [Chenggangzhangella methanolivorans]|uniref:AraC family transcriptional regulator n=1 Tax=Chenggangzhangella methanolivorans TaxID=1437009 RepID=A0A9E6RDY6_9HYPH|nr:AraC family transcriptional regulator [Chenggangzhangella methanolivorans]QZN99061.1 AraC family transcriptional regulator [Chenggangzhangella methanolivorans]
MVPETTGEDGTEAARTRIAAIVRRHLGGEMSRDTVVPGLSIHGKTAAMEPGSYLYEPSFAFIARGAKRVVLGQETYVYDEGRFLLTAVGLPTVVQVIGASAENPYLSLKLDIDLEMARGLITEVDLHVSGASVAGAGLAVGPVTPALVAATLRLAELLDAPGDVPILAGSVQREILYRVLTSPVGGRLRQAVRLGTQTNRVAAAIRWIRENYTAPLRIDDLADAVGMGESTLHHHFRALTAMSPLQYQKLLRLHEARRLMLAEHADAGVAAHKVGYESATQFSREYRRMFGTPPKQDVRAILSPHMAVPPA